MSLYQRFINGEYGVSHAVIATLMLLVGSHLGNLMGDALGALCGNLFMSGAAVGAYYMREVVQHDSYDPRTWSIDGQLDAAFPALIVMLNLVIIYLVWP